MVYRIYVEKKEGFDVEAQGLYGEIRSLLGIKALTGLRILNRYDVEGISSELFTSCIATVFSEPQVDTTYDKLPKGDDTVFGVEYLPGQFDQRADSASQCVQLISQGERPTVRSARIFLLAGALSAEELAAVKKYVINPVEAKEADLAEKQTLAVDYPIPTTVETLDGFRELSTEALADFVKSYGLAMDKDDVLFCRNYFRTEQRDPTITEIRMIDTYWSDHCRHTTFGTVLDEVKISNALVQKAFDRYLEMRAELYAGRNKPICLMDMATIGGKWLKKKGVLKNLDESEEINACTVKIKVDVDGEQQDW
ncbi:MAG: phosphoribosylformylglycinamidine synthase, partial [Angelakisella sp.]